MTHDSNHAAGRSLSAFVHARLPEVDGILYPSRFIGDDCVAVLDRATHKLEAESITSLTSHADFLQALREYDVSLTTR